jgi:exopolysaccharide biosynthesis protein
VQVDPFTKLLLLGVCLVAVILILVGCNIAYSATATPVPPTSTPTSTAEPTNNSTSETWQTILTGLELRTYVPTDRVFGQVMVLRIDPTLFTFRVHYSPGEPLSTSEWRSELSDAVAFVNANFFDRQNYIVGLLVADGVVYGSTFVDLGGTFAIQDGQPVLRSNILEPYQGEVFEQAVQAFPMLILNGTQAYTDTAGDRATRRTIVAQDAQGRILLIATPLLGMRMADLAEYLLTTDLEIASALNLDGGASTMMVVQAEDPYVIRAFDRVPAVLAVYAR